MTLAWNVVIQYLSLYTVAYADVSSDQVWLPRNQQFRRFIKYIVERAVSYTHLLLCLVILLVKELLSVYAHFVVLGLVISSGKSAHLVWLPRDQWYRIHKDSTKF